MYYPGSTITGNVLLDVTKPYVYKYASVKFVGRSYVYWEVNSGDAIYRYRSENPLTEHSAMLWTCQQTPDGKLGVGKYSWPFSFTIPPVAPSSFEGTLGNVRYLLEARVKTSVLKFDHVVEVRIPVQQLVSVSNPRLMLPQRFEAEKTLCCLSCASGAITMNATIPKTGFILRESFSLHVSIENGSNRRITLNASICQWVIYKVKSHQNTSKKTLVSYASDPIEPHASREWDPLIEIPVTEIIHEWSCKNIQTQYSLVVSAKIPRALDLNRAIPLQLGNCSVQQQGGTIPAPPAQGTVNLPSSQTEPHPCPASTCASAYSPTTASVSYLPQWTSGYGANAVTPIDQSTSSVPAANIPDDSPNPASDNENTRLL